MKIALFACLIFLSLVSIVHGANVSLSFAECQTDTTSNNTYCAPVQPTINQSTIYQQCIADTNSRFSDLNASFNNIATNITKITEQLNTALVNLNISDVVGRYSSCVIALNASITNSSFWYAEYQQSAQELVTTVSRANSNQVNSSQLIDCQNSVNSLQSQKQQAQNDVTTYALIAFAAGIGVMWYFKTQRGPSGSNDSRGERPPIPGRA